MLWGITAIAAPFPTRRMTCTNARRRVTTISVSASVSPCVPRSDKCIKPSVTIQTQAPRCTERGLGIIGCGNNHASPDGSISVYPSLTR